MESHSDAIPLYTPMKSAINRVVSSPLRLRWLVDSLARSLGGKIPRDSANNFKCAEGCVTEQYGFHIHPVAEMNGVNGHDQALHREERQRDLVGSGQGSGLPVPQVEPGER